MTDTIGRLVLFLFLNAAALKASTQLSLEHLTYSGTQATNAPSFQLQITNLGGQDIDLDRLAVKYWYSAEGGSTEQVEIGWAGKLPAGTAITNLVTRQISGSGAQHHIALGFSGAAGALAAGSKAVIHVWYHNADWTNYDQLNDFSFSPTSSFTANPNISLYLDGQLISGTEPGGSGSASVTPASSATASSTATPSPSPSRTRTGTPTPFLSSTASPAPTATPTAPAVPTQLHVQYSPLEAGAASGRIKFRAKIFNGGASAADVSGLALKYWFRHDVTVAEAEALESELTGSGTDLLQGTVVEVLRPVAGSDLQAISVSFSELDQLLSPGDSIELTVEALSPGQQDFLQTDDYSFSFVGALQVWDRITLYDGSGLVWGIEPPMAPATGTPTVSATRTPTQTPTATPAQTNLAPQPSSTYAIPKLDLEVWKPSSDPNEQRLAVKITNWGCDPVDLGRIKVGIWIQNPGSATLIADSYSNNQSVWDQGGHWTSNVGKPLVSVETVPAIACTDSSKANTHLVIGFPQGVEIPPFGGYLATNPGNDALFSMHLSDWSNLNLSSSYSNWTSAGNSASDMKDVQGVSLLFDGALAQEFKKRPVGLAGVAFDVKTGIMPCAVAPPSRSLIQSQAWQVGQSATYALQKVKDGQMIEGDTIKLTVAGEGSGGRFLLEIQRVNDPSVSASIPQIDVDGIKIEVEPFGPEETMAFFLQNYGRFGATKALVKVPAHAAVSALPPAANEDLSELGDYIAQSFVNDGKVKVLLEGQELLCDRLQHSDCSGLSGGVTGVTVYRSGQVPVTGVAAFRMRVKPEPGNDGADEIVALLRSVEDNATSGIDGQPLAVENFDHDDPAFSRSFAATATPMPFPTVAAGSQDFGYAVETFSDPISTLDGTLSFESEDFNHKRPGFPFSFVRRYNPKNNAYGLPFGQSWTTDYHDYVFWQNDNLAIFLIQSDRIIKFTRADTSQPFTCEPGGFHTAQLLASPAGHSRTLKILDKYGNSSTFSSISPGPANISKIIEKADTTGNKLFFDYEEFNTSSLGQLAGGYFQAWTSHERACFLFWCWEYAQTNFAYYGDPLFIPSVATWDTRLTQVRSNNRDNWKITFEYSRTVQDVSYSQLTYQVANYVAGAFPTPTPGPWIYVPPCVGDDCPPYVPPQPNYSVMVQSVTRAFPVLNTNWGVVTNVRSYSNGQQIDRVQYSSVANTGAIVRVYPFIIVWDSPIVFQVANRTGLTQVLRGTESSSSAGYPAYYAYAPNAASDINKPLMLKNDPKTESPIQRFEYKLDALNLPTNVIEKVFNGRDQLQEKLEIDNSVAGKTTSTLYKGTQRYQVFEYEANKLSKKTTYLDNPGGEDVFTSEYVYNADFLPISVKDENGNETTSVYDSNGNLRFRTVPIGNGATATEEYTYTSDNRVDLHRDFRNNTVDYDYNPDGTVQKISYPLGKEVSYTYKSGLPGGLVDTEIQRIDVSTYATKTYFYDPYGNVEFVRQPSFTDHQGILHQGELVETRHDIRGRLEYEVNAAGDRTENTWNLRDELEQIKYPDLSVRTRTYTTATPLGKVETDSYLGVVSRYAYDLDGNCEDKYFAYGSPDEVHHHYDYDAWKNNIRVVQDAGSATPKESVTAFNRADLPKEMKDPLNRAKYFSYDGLRNLTRRVDERGVTSDFSYWESNRLKDVVYSDGTGSKHFEYDENGNRTLSRFGYATPLQSSSETGEQVFVYDALNRLSDVSSRFGSAVEANADFHLEYDFLSRKTKVASPQMGSILLGYFENGPLKTLIDVDGKFFKYTYNKLNQIESLDYPDQLIHSAYEYYPKTNTLKKVSHVDKQGSVISQVEYEYDGFKNVRAYTDLIGRVEMDYDKLNQVKSVTYPDDVRADETYQYDGAGNPTVFEGQTRTYNNLLNQLDALGGQSLSYDDAGNVTQLKGGTLSWDAENRLVGVDQFRFNYDGDNLRMRVEAPDHSLEYHFYATGNYYLFENAGKTTRVVPGLLAQEIGSSEKQYFLTNGRGDVISVLSSQGQLLQDYQYHVFGRARGTGDDSNPFKFSYRSGALWDSGVNLVYMRNRWYDPDLGRFISRDPIGIDGGLNLYGYVDNNPLTFVDPFGLYKTWDQKLGDGDYYGTGYGEEAAQYYADQFVQTGKYRYALGGGLASLWTPSTFKITGLTLAGAGLLAGPAAAAGPPLAVPNIGVLGPTNARYFGLLDRANRIGFRLDRPHWGHAARGLGNWFRRNFAHFHFWTF